jgi:hypothetical protein
VSVSYDSSASALLSLPLSFSTSWPGVFLSSLSFSVVPISASASTSTYHSTNVPGCISNGEEEDDDDEFVEKLDHVDDDSDQDPDSGLREVLGFPSSRGDGDGESYRRSEVGFALKAARRFVGWNLFDFPFDFDFGREFGFDCRSFRADKWDSSEKGEVGEVGGVSFSSHCSSLFSSNESVALESTPSDSPIFLLRAPVKVALNRNFFWKIALVLFLFRGKGDNDVVLALGVEAEVAGVVGVVGELFEEEVLEGQRDRDVGRQFFLGSIARGRDDEFLVGKFASGR